MKPQQDWKILENDNQTFESTLIKWSNPARAYMLLVKLKVDLVLSISRSVRCANVTLISFNAKNDIGKMCRRFIKLGFSGANRVHRGISATGAKEIAGLWHQDADAAVRAIVGFLRAEKIARVEMKHVKKTRGAVVTYTLR